MTKELAVVRWAVLLALVLFAVALTGAAVSAARGWSGSDSGHVLSLMDDPDAGGQ
jgi:hypothetical protein